MRPGLWLPLAFAGLMALLPQAARAQTPIQSYDSYKSWFVACDNTLACVARGFSQDGGRAELTITREAGPQGAIHALLGSETAFGTDQLSLDGAPLTVGPAWKRSSDADSTALTTTDFAAIRALVQALRNGSSIGLPGDGTIPLDGFTAALRRMDARQGRTGGVTALLDLGSKPASAVPPALPVPVIPTHPIKATLAAGEGARLIADTRRKGAAVLTQEQCDAQVDGMDPAAYALDQKQALVLIPCIMRAYQGSFIGFLAERATGAARELVPPIPYQGNDPDRATSADLTEAEFDPATGTLAMAAKGRGLADCGMSASWIWDGAAFRLSAMTLQESCGGLEPGDWPTLFRSRP